jgi:hypothetical protein
MIFNEIQLKLWSEMIQNIKSFRRGNIQYSDLVYELEGALDAGEYKDVSLNKEWFKYWIPLEILSAQKGNNTTICEADKNLQAMENFLQKKLDLLSTGFTSEEE